MILILIFLGHRVLFLVKMSLLVLFSHHIPFNTVWLMLCVHMCVQIAGCYWRLQWNYICIWPDRLWKVIHNAGNYWTCHSERNHSQVNLLPIFKVFCCHTIIVIAWQL